MSPLLGYGLVFLGAGFGGSLRHAVNQLLPVASFPLATLIVNVTGCFLMGLLAGYLAFRGEEIPQGMRLALATGLLGGYTTFSAFSLDAALLWQRGEMGALAIYVAGSVLLSLLGVFAGLAVIKNIL